MRRKGRGEGCGGEQAPLTVFDKTKIHLEQGENQNTLTFWITCVSVSLCVSHGYQKPVFLWIYFEAAIVRILTKMFGANFGSPKGTYFKHLSVYWAKALGSSCMPGGVQQSPQWQPAVFARETLLDVEVLLYPRLQFAHHCIKPRKSVFCFQ